MCAAMSTKWNLVHSYVILSNLDYVTVNRLLTLEDLPGLVKMCEKQIIFPLTLIELGCNQMYCCRAWVPVSSCFLFSKMSPAPPSNKNKRNLDECLAVSIYLITHNEIALVSSVNEIFMLFWLD